jgi:3-dehydroquinate dehydratase-2
MILLLNGPGLALLGERQPELHGTTTLPQVEQMVREVCASYGLELQACQSNWEGALLDFLEEHRQRVQGVIVNPGALARQSHALAACLAGLGCPVVEVLLANPHAGAARPARDLVAPACTGLVAGLGAAGYHHAAVHLCGLLTQVAQAGTGDDLPGEESEQIPVDTTARGDYEG